jgi:serine protease
MKFRKHQVWRAAFSALVLGAAASTSAVAGVRDGQVAPLVASAKTDRLIVKFKDASETVVLNGQEVSQARSVDAMQMQARINRMSQVAQAHGTRMFMLRQTGVGSHVFQLSKEMSEEQMQALAAAVAASDSAVEYAEPDRKMFPLLTPNDTSYSSQWDLYEDVGGIRAPAAWDRSTGSGVVVAVLDTGIRPHVDLSGQLVAGYDMIANVTTANDGNGRDSDASDPGDWSTGSGCPASDSSWHGTHVAGTIGAKTNNAAGIAGIAFNSKVQSIRVLGRCGGYTSDIADGMIWASGGSVSGAPANATPAKVLNLSLGGSGACDSTSQAAINSARSRGSVVVVAAGNSNVNVSNATPANCAGVIAVASTTRQGGKSSFSNFGTLVDLAAPGSGILSTLNAGKTTPGADNYVAYSGTSMAAPHVAGVAALMFSVKSTATPDQIESALKSSARAFPATCSGCGTGILDANAAISAILGNTPPPPPPPPAPPTVNEVESNNTLATANTLSVPSKVLGQIASTTDIDHFKISLPAGKTLSGNLALSKSTTDFDLYVLNSSGSVLVRSERAAGQAESVSYRNAGTSAITVYVQVKYYSGGAGGYTLNVGW